MDDDCVNASIPTISWDKICRTKYNGRLGIRKRRTLMLLILENAVGRFLLNQEYLAQLMKVEYLKNN